MYLVDLMGNQDASGQARIAEVSRCSGSQTYGRVTDELMKRAGFQEMTKKRCHIPSFGFVAVSAHV